MTAKKDPGKGLSKEAAELARASDPVWTAPEKKSDQEKAAKRRLKIWKQRQGVEG